MGIDYAKLQTRVTGVMGRVKQGTVVLVRTSWSTPVDPTVAPVSTDTTHTLSAAVSGVSQEFVDGTTVLASDLQVTCAVPSVTPDMETDGVLIDGVRHAIVRVTPIPSAGTPAAYRLIVRR